MDPAIRIIEGILGSLVATQGVSRAIFKNI
jgi:hypothetical protein